jgi:hypothetical protein
MSQGLVVLDMPHLLVLWFRHHMSEFLVQLVLVVVVCLRIVDVMHLLEGYS